MNYKNLDRCLSLYEKQRLAEVTAVKQRLSDSLRGIAKGVIKPVPQRDAMKVLISSWLQSYKSRLVVRCLGKVSRRGGVKGGVKGWVKSGWDGESMRFRFTCCSLFAFLRGLVSSLFVTPSPPLRSTIAYSGVFLHREYDEKNRTRTHHEPRPHTTGCEGIFPSLIRDSNPRRSTALGARATQVEQALLSAEIHLGAVRDAVESIAEKFPHLRDVLGRLSRLSEDATG